MWAWETLRTEDIPTPGRGEVLVKVMASNINPATWWHIWTAMFVRLTFPYASGNFMYSVIHCLRLSVSVLSQTQNVYAPPNRWITRSWKWLVGAGHTLINSAMTLRGSSKHLVPIACACMLAMKSGVRLELSELSELSTSKLTHSPDFHARGHLFNRSAHHSWYLCSVCCGV